MIATYASASALIVVSLALGGAVCVRRGWSWLAPAVGLCAAVAVAYLGVRLPGHGATAAVLLGLATVGSVVVLVGRIDLGELARGLVPAAIVLGLCSIPFVLNGRVGVLGVSFNDDPMFHLAWADALRSAGDVGYLRDPGYPLGPHALMAALARAFGTEVDRTFTGVMLAVPVLTALTALSALDHLSQRLRVIGAVLVALPYLSASYFAEASFKEPMMGLVALASALVVREVARGRLDRWRAAAAFALLAGGSVYMYSYTGLAWPLAVGGAAAGVVLLQHRRRVRALARRAAAPAAFAAALAGLLVLADLGRVIDFYDSPRNRMVRAGGGSGNFAHHLSPLEVLGVWPSFDFRLDPTLDPLWWKAGAALAALAAVAGAAWWLWRRDPALPAGAAAALLLWVGADRRAVPYYSFKSLVVAAPLVMAVAAGGLLALSPGRTWRRVAWAGATAAFVVLTLHSSLLALRGAPVRPGEHADDLGALRPLVRNGNTLLVSRDHYGPWDLHGAHVWSFTDYAFGLAGQVVPRPQKLGGQSGVDADSLDPSQLARYRYVVLPRTAYASLPPPEWRLRRRTRWWELYERRGREPARLVLAEADAPGAVLGCARRKRGSALVRRPPVTGDGWHLPRSAGRGVLPGDLAPGGALETRLRLPAGRFELSLQYQSVAGLHINAGRLRASLPAELSDSTTYWRVGTLRSAGTMVTATVRMPRLRRWAQPVPARLGALAAAPVPAGARRLPMRRACGRYVDWYVTR